MDGGDLQPYAEGLRDFAAPEFAVVLLFVVVSGTLAGLLFRQVLALVRGRRGPQGR
jgi:NADH:ubiquinone oxidoreductase subunit H